MAEDYVPCPTPDKMRWDTRRLAKFYARRFRRNGLGKHLRVYRCCCTKWHLTSNTNPITEG